MKQLTVLLFIALTSFTACKFNAAEAPKLPIYGNRETATKVVDGKQVVDTIYQTIPAFKFINQYGDSISNKSLDGYVYVADFFFTTCPSICPIMHRNMLKVYNDYKSVNDFKIISHTIDPKHDSVAVLKKYADKLGINGQSWWLLQGGKEETYGLAKNYLVQRPEESKKELFIHDGYFILVDKKKQIRGMYDGTDEKQVDKLRADIKILLAENKYQNSPMKLKVIGAILALIMIVIASCQSDDEMEFQRYYNGGKALYEQKCQNCHSAKGEGLSNLIPPLSDADYLKKNKATLACMVKYGIKETIITVNGKSYEGAMPATDLAPVDIAKVLTYVTNSFGNNMGVIRAEHVDDYLAECK